MPKCIAVLVIFIFISFSFCLAQKSDYSFQPAVAVNKIKPYFNGKLFIDSGVIDFTPMTKGPTNKKYDSKQQRRMDSLMRRPLSINVSSDSSSAEMFSEMLYYENEPRLPLDTEQVIYRFVWLRSLTGDAVVKLFIKDNKLIIQFRWLRSLRTDTKELPLSKLAEFDDILNKYNFWKTKEVQAQMLSTDGSDWLIEGQKGKKYHFVYRRNPSTSENEGLFYIGEWLIKNSYCKSTIGAIY
jgi:hypothetical protein